jgi:hypothetical protein
MFLDLNPDMKEKFQQYCKDHLQELSIELVSKYMYDTQIQFLVFQKYKIAMIDDDNYDYSVTTLYLEYDFKHFCPSTIYKWWLKHKLEVKLCGIEYSAHWR